MTSSSYGSAHCSQFARRQSLGHRLKIFTLLNPDHCRGSVNLEGMWIWMLFLLDASLLFAQEASLDCSAIAAAQTQPLRGPAGLTALVKISAEDDHSKDSHDCMAEYKLVVQPQGRAAVITDILSSDGDWGRKLHARLDGFSLDGKQVFGILSEAGPGPSAMIFRYHTASQQIELLDLKKALKQMAAAKCAGAAAVVGTTDSGSIVVESTPRSQCGISWLFDPASQTLRRLPQSQSVHTLFK